VDPKNGTSAEEREARGGAEERSEFLALGDARAVRVHWGSTRPTPCCFPFPGVLYDPMVGFTRGGMRKSLPGWWMRMEGVFREGLRWRWARPTVLGVLMLLGFAAPALGARRTTERRLPPTAMKRCSRGEGFWRRIADAEP